MHYAVRTPEAAWPIRFHVESGEAVIPGAPVVDIMTFSGLVHTLTSEFHGIVTCTEDGDTLYKAGAMLCHILSREDRNSRQKGLVPKPSTWQRFMRFGR
jgi:hypothetical protein